MMKRDGLNDDASKILLESHVESLQFRQPALWFKTNDLRTLFCQLTLIKAVLINMLLLKMEQISLFVASLMTLFIHPPCPMHVS